MLAIIDDDEMVRTSLEGLLQAMGYEVVTYPSAAHFLDGAATSALDCILLDVHMPGMTGPELQQRLVSAGVRTPIIFVTAHYDDALRARLTAAGAVACLSKPLVESALTEALESAIAR